MVGVRIGALLGYELQVAQKMVDCNLPGGQSYAMVILEGTAFLVLKVVLRSVLKTLRNF